jgi:hypothetical protein
MNNELAVRESVKAEVSGFEMKPRTMEEAMNFCTIMAASELVPKCYQDKPGNIMVAIQMGGELGISPMRALRSIAVINGRASMWGDDVLAMVLASPVCEYVDESESNDKQGVCRTKRKGCKEQVSVYTIADAQAAGLLGKTGPWQTNRPRMLKLRARGFGLRDNFADVLAGLVTAEEALDLPPVEAEAGAATILEANQPLTLKDKLKAKVDAVDAPSRIPSDQAASDGTDCDRYEKLIIEPMQRLVDVLPPSSDDPSEPWKAKLRTAHDSKTVNLVYNECPEELRQNIYATYSDKLKQLKGK